MNDKFIEWLVSREDKTDAVGCFYLHIKKKKIVKADDLDKYLRGKVPVWVKACYRTAVNEWKEAMGVGITIAKAGIIKPVVSWVHRQFKEYGKVVDEDIKGPDVIAVRHFVTESAEVTRQLSLTVDLGGYQSTQVKVGVKLPCYVEELDAANLVIRQWVTGQIEEQIDEITGEGGFKGNKNYKTEKIGITKITEFEKENIDEDIESLF